MVARFVTDLGRKLLVLVGNEMDTEGEVVDTGALASEVEDLDLRVGDTTVETRLGVRLVCSETKKTSAFHLEIVYFASFLQSFVPPHPIKSSSCLRNAISMDLWVSRFGCKTYSCSNGSSGRDGGPFLRILGGLSEGVWSLVRQSWELRRGENQHLG